MNNHEELKILISAYIDGEVTPEEEARVKKALAEDLELRKYYEQLKNASVSFSSWTDEDLSPDLERRMQSELHLPTKEGIMSKKTWMAAGIGGTIAVAVAALAVSMNVYKEDDVAKRLKSRPAVTVAERAVDERQEPQSAAVSLPQKGQTAQSPLSKVEGKVPPAADAAAQKAAYEPVYLRAQSPESLTALSRYAPGSADGTAFQSYGSGTAARMASDSIYADRPVSPPVTYGYPVKGGTAMPYPEQQWNTEGYDAIYENPMLEAKTNPLSTFSIDVDTASYSNIRRFLNYGQLPPKDAVRIEEMINYFVYDYPRPQGGAPFSITTEGAVCPWNTDHQLVLIGLQGKDLDARNTPPSNLVFLIDVSGSMNTPEKLPLLKQSFEMMVERLRPEERVAIVTYPGNAGLVLNSTSGAEKETILHAIRSLQPGGSTAGAAGIQLAYQIARQNFIEGGNNRVILATDGDFNVGVSSDAELTRIIEERRKDGIFLTALGFGMGNYKDSKLEKLADKGNGNYYYIDNIREAKKVLVDEIGSTLFTIAKDVKIQIEFNPAKVKAYRLIGYENRILAKEDFNDDTKDAGELGAGHTVTALYEIVPADSEEVFGGVDELKYQKTVPQESDEVMTVKLRYKDPDGETSKLITRVLKDGDLKRPAVSNNMQWASAVAESGLLLRDSKFKGTASVESVLSRARAAKGEDRWGYRAEFIDLMEKAGSHLINKE